MDAALIRWCEGVRREDHPLLQAWWPLVRSAASDEIARKELLGLVAVEARATGQQGQPPSRSLQRWHVLARAFPEARAWLEPILATVADAHVIGAVVRAEEVHRRRLRRSTPVLDLGSGRLLLVLSGSPDAESLDHLLGRLFQRAVAVGGQAAIIDASGVLEPDDTLIRTLGGIGSIGLPPYLRVVVAGLRTEGDLGPRVRRSLSLTETLASLGSPEDEAG